MRTLVYIVVLLYSIIFQPTWTYVIRDTENTDLSKDHDSTLYLIQILKALDRLQKENRLLKDFKDYFSRKDKENYNDRQYSNIKADKRDFGILPPWNELCRMMKISYCKSSHS